MAMALIISTAQWNMIFIFISADIGSVIIKKIIRNPAKQEFPLSIIVFCAYAISLTVIAIIVNYFEETSIWNLWAKAVKLSDLAIVEKGYFNYIFWCCLFCGIISKVWHY